LLFVPLLFCWCVSDSLKREMFKGTLKFLPKLVIATAIVPVLTVIICISMTKILGHVPEIYVLPQISLTGNHSPERWVYLVGFGSTSLMMLFMVTVLHTEVTPYFFRRSCVNGFAYFLAILFSIGLLTQSVFCLQEDFADSMSTSGSVITVESLMAWLQTTTVLHLLGAGIFFFSALVYVIVMVIGLAFSIKEVPKSIPDGYVNPFGGKWYIWKICCLAAYCLFLLVSDFGGDLFSDTRTKIFVGAFGQWSCVLSFILFCLSFSFDISRFIKLNPYLFPQSNTDPSVPSAIAMVSEDEGSNMVRMEPVKPAAPAAVVSSSSASGKKPSSKEDGADIEKKSLIANDSMFTIVDEDDDAPLDDDEEIKPEDLL